MFWSPFTTTDLIQNDVCCIWLTHEVIRFLFMKDQAAMTSMKQKLQTGKDQETAFLLNHFILQKCDIIL